MFQPINCFKGIEINKELMCVFTDEGIARLIEDIPAQFIKFFPLLLEKKMNISQLARVCKLSRPTVYKYLRLIGNAAETLEDENGKEEWTQS